MLEKLFAFPEHSKKEIVCLYKQLKKFVPEELMLLNRMAQINEVLVMMTQTKMILEL